MINRIKHIKDKSIPKLNSSIKWKDVCDESFLASVLECIHDAVVVCNADGKIVYVNTAYTRDLEIKYEKVVGMSIHDVAPESVLCKVLKSGQPFVNQPSRILKLGIDVVSSSTPIYKAGTMVGAVSIFKIMSEIKRLHSELERMTNLKNYLQQQLDLQVKYPQVFENIIANNKQMKDTLMRAMKAARSDVTILVQGETGTGKDLICRAIHYASNRNTGPLIEINCAAIPENLLESELFGYEEGSFTGAKRGGKLGKFELAHKGTLFLNEIGDMSMTLQAKLLGAIQEKEIERVGGTEKISTDVRVIAATNQDLEKRIIENKFRMDLFFRLSVFNIYVPPLRDRKDDIPLLIAHFLKKNVEREKKDISLSQFAINVLMQYDWPGNIRELQNAIECAVISANGTFIEPDDFPKQILSRRFLQQHATNALDTGNQCSLEKEKSALEKASIIRALEKSNNNKSNAIKMLGISRSQFYKKLALHGFIHNDNC